MLCSLAATCCLMRGTSGDILEADEGQAIMLETVERVPQGRGRGGLRSRREGHADDSRRF